MAALEWIMLCSDPDRSAGPRRSARVRVRRARTRWALALLTTLAASCGGSEQSSGQQDGGLCGSQACGAGDAPGAACTDGTATLRMTGKGASSSYCIGSSCSLQWLTIKTPSGDVLPLSHDCMSDCVTCQQTGCPAICPMPRQIDPAGESLTWDGTYFLGTTCGAAIPCGEQHCAPPGTYFATMCLYVNGTPDAGWCSTGQTPVCAEIAFAFPSSGVVVTQVVGPGP